MYVRVFDSEIFVECVYMPVYVYMDRFYYFKFTVFVCLLPCVFSKERERMNEVVWVVSRQDLNFRNLERDKYSQMINFLQSFTVSELCNYF